MSRLTGSPLLIIKVLRLINEAMEYTKLLYVTIQSTPL